MSIELGVMTVTVVTLKQRAAFSSADLSEITLA